MTLPVSLSLVKEDMIAGAMGDALGGKSDTFCESVEPCGTCMCTCTDYPRNPSICLPQMAMLYVFRCAQVSVPSKRGCWRASIEDLDAHRYLADILF
jgi:hypothetical protein